MSHINQTDVGVEFQSKSLIGMSESQVLEYLREVQKHAACVSWILGKMKDHRRIQEAESFRAAKLSS
jgi:hypothetical protein